MIKSIRKHLNWLLPTRPGAAVDDIASIFPEAFDRYYKIYFPLGYCENFPAEDYPSLPDSIEELNRRAAIGKLFYQPGQWEVIRPELLQPIGFRAIADLLNIPFNAKFGIQQIYRQLGGRSVQFQRYLPYEIAVIDQLTRWLKPTTKAWLFDYGNFQLAELDEPYEQDWLRKIKLSEWSDIFSTQNEFLKGPSPYVSAYLFDPKKTWCLAAGKGLGSHFILLAVNEKLGEDLEKMAHLEWLRLEKTEKGELKY